MTGQCSGPITTAISNASERMKVDAGKKEKKKLLKKRVKKARGK